MRRSVCKLFPKISAIVCILLMGACSNMDHTDRSMVYGAGLGAGLGAATSAAYGGCIACGAAIGGTAGAVSGYAIDRSHYY